jgi:streptomycin 6-kinase
MTVRSARQRLDEHAREWNVVVKSTKTTETSLVAFGVRGNQRVVLKVARHEGEEWRSGELLAAFNGNGLVRALDYTEGAVLLEELTPGNDLVSLCLGGRDDEATKVIAGIIKQMSSIRPSVPGFIFVRDLAAGFQRHRHNCDGLMLNGMVEKAELMFVELCESQGDIRLLHGDLHHYNVLFDSRLGWVAIDPWGLRAEIEYEIGASLRNPIAAPDLLAMETTVVNRLKLYEGCLEFNTARALRWAFSQAVLAALWPTEPGVGIDMRIPFTLAAKAMMPLISD